MAEVEWDDPVPLLELLRASGRASDRKLRLFAAACGRSVWGLLPGEQFCRAIELLERLADGEVTWEVFQADTEAVWETILAPPPRDLPDALRSAARAVFQAVRGLEGGGYHADFARWAALHFAAGTAQAGSSERAKQCQLLRDIAGDLFHPRSPLDPALLRWHGGLI